MRIFISVSVESEPGQDPGMDQRVAGALGMIGLSGEAMGGKGPVRLPRHLFTDVVDLEPFDDETPRRAIDRLRRSTADECSRLLADIGFRGAFFLTVSRATAWAYRPVPRKPKQEDESSSDHAAVSLDAIGR